MVADALLWYLVRRTRDSADSEGSAEDNGSLLLQPLEIRRDAVWSVFLMELTATISVWISVHRTILHREKPIKSKFPLKINWSHQSEVGECDIAVR